VALLSIPAIGISAMVVVEGTTPENLTLGPGHLRDTPLPGQAGISVIFGSSSSPTTCSRHRHTGLFAFPPR